MSSPTEEIAQKAEDDISAEPEKHSAVSSAVDDGPSTAPPGSIRPGPPASEAAADPESLQRTSSGPAYSTFPKATKRWVIGMAAFASFVSPMTANIYFPALTPIAHDLGVTVNLINLTLTTYMIFQAIAPTIVGDFGDMAGRRPAFILSFLVYIFANLGLALQKNYAALLVLRMLQSAGSSGTLSLSYAVVADVAVSAERGKYMGIVGAGINVGPALSPVLGGILGQYLGWRAIFWFCLIYTAVWLIPYSLAVPETCRKVVGNGSIPARGWNMTFVDLLLYRRRRAQRANTCSDPATTTPPKRQLRFPNPIHTLKVVFEKQLALLLFYNTMIYLVFILIAATLSTQVSDIYHLTDLQIGLCYLPYGLGCCAAALSQGFILDTNYRRIARNIGFTIDYKRGDDLRNFPIERARIMPIYPLLSVGVASVIAYGWVLQAETNLAGPLVLLFVVGLCVTGSFSILNTLLVDLYPEAPATAVAANNLVRCLFGAVCTAFIEYMLKALGRGWTYTFWALILVVFSPVLYLQTIWGPAWREERRVKKLEEKEKEEAAAAAAAAGAVAI
ncbi:major facilitator superfamily domain-containing protein [Dichotomopilus funicola]|uniref:Major facilitator superfamily domain-containing protein n=1 Tax=Dichotomopilus funicola TaxID=1934379 RepID=A0AAN6V887_9PEZI|nr:major facilitator superfamily domain-containing protein [Dichotomopilus funicola]